MQLGDAPGKIKITFGDRGDWGSAAPVVHTGLVFPNLGKVIPTEIRPPPGYEYGFFCPECRVVELQVVGRPRYGEPPLRCYGCDGRYLVSQAVELRAGGSEEGNVCDAFKESAEKLSKNVDEMIKAFGLVAGDIAKMLEGSLGGPGHGHIPDSGTLIQSNEMSRAERRANASPRKKGTGKVPSWMNERGKC